MFFLSGSAPGPLTIARIGLPGTVTLDPSETYLGLDGNRALTIVAGASGSILRLRPFGTTNQIDRSLELGSAQSFVGSIGDRVVTAAASGSGSIVHLWDLARGSQVGDGTGLPWVVGRAVGAAGSDLVVASSIAPNATDHGVVAVSTVDGSVRTLIAPAAPSSLVAPQRIAVLSESNDQVASAICATGVDFVGQCTPTAIVDLPSGALLRTMDLGGRQPVRFTSAWILAGDIAGDELLDAQGRHLWSSSSLGEGATVWASQVAPDGRLVVEIRSISGRVEPRLLALDPSAGRQTTLYRPPSTTEWHVWPDLSTSTLVAIGRDAFQAPCMTEPCGPDDLREADASTFDLATGQLDAGGIHITFGP